MADQNESKTVAYWRSLEEQQGALSFEETLKGEWVAPPLQGLGDPIERRSFLKMMGVGALFAATACYRRPAEQIVPYVNKPEQVTPGVSNWYASVCRECIAGCGLLVKTRESRPIKLEGNPRHPVSKGGLCARGQASILNLYDPDRLQNPVKMSAGAELPLDLIQLDQSIKSELSGVIASGKKIAFLTGVTGSPATRDLINDFLNRFYPEMADRKLVVSYEPAFPEEILAASRVSYGESFGRSLPAYRFEKADFILSFGADFLGTYLSPVEFAKGFSSSRKADEGRMARFVCFESVLSLTGTNADEYFPIRAGEEFFVAALLAREVLRQLGLDGQYDSLFARYEIDVFSQKLGISADVFKRLASELVQYKGKGLVLGGPVKGKYAFELQLVVNLLNSVLGNNNTTIQFYDSPVPGFGSSFADLERLISEMKSGAIGALFIYRSNPVYTLPAGLGFVEALKNVPLTVSFADRVDESAALCHYVCPDTHDLESWGDFLTKEGVLSLIQPTVSPIYSGIRSFQDSLIKWADLPIPSWYEYLRKKSMAVVQYADVDFESFWKQTLKEGYYFQSFGFLSIPEYNSAEAAPVFQDLKFPSGDLFLSFYPSVAMYDGRSANNAWLNELPDPVSKITWENYLSISPDFAAKKGLVEGDVVRLKGDGIDFSIAVHLQPKMKEGQAIVAVGYGRSRAGRIASDTTLGERLSVNVYPFQKRIDRGDLEWGGFAVAIEKSGKVHSFANTQHHFVIDSKEREDAIIQQVPFAAVSGSHDSDHGSHHDSHGQEGDHAQHPDLWPGHEYKGYRWGMSIDLNACIGCSACTIACQAENNIPVVGKDQVLNGREMHWIRIDRYHFGSVQNPKMIHQPMLCQHCENAPCETVCPTLATVHDSEGLNTMVYNRCVGTRYCSNNCPYKVRRFNFFDYYSNPVYKKLNASESPRSLVLNPDITTRSRGIMEKCTFCMQRIREGKDHAKDHARRVHDGEVKTACQQTCPTDAISFGDQNDPHSVVSRLNRSKRGYKVLESGHAQFNFKPQITYLKKVER